MEESQPTDAKEKIEPEFSMLQPGLEVQGDIYSHLCWQFNQLFKVINKSQGKNNEFVGSQPVSLQMSDLSKICLGSKDYLLSEKTDGVRYMLVIDNYGGAYLHGRKTREKTLDNLSNPEKKYNNLIFFQSNIQLPKVMFTQTNSKICLGYQSQISVDDKQLIAYLFDGELVLDTYKDSNTNQITKVCKYLIFDTLIHNYQFVHDKEYWQRLQLAELFQKYKQMCFSINEEVCKKTQEVENLYQIELQVKDFFYIKQLSYLLNIYIKQLPHSNDGIIFTHTSPYKSKTNEYMIKWKPPEKNTIDFLLEFDEKLSKLCKSYVYQIKITDYDNNFSDNNEVEILFDFLIANESQHKEIENAIIEKKKITELAVHGIVVECCYSKLSPEFPQALLQIYKLLQLDYKVKEEEAETAKKENIAARLLDFTDYLDTEIENYKIIEKLLDNYNKFFQNQFTKGWKIDKIRSDKNASNHLTVVSKILKTISDNITEEKLISYFQKSQNSVNYRQ